MQKKLFGTVAFFIYMWMSIPAFGHGLWVNAHKVEAHPPGHVLATIGFGHFPPLDDLLQTEYGNLELEHYSLIDPKNGPALTRT